MSEIKTLEDMRNTVKTIAADCDEGWLLPSLDAIQAEVDERFMELPVDADGVPIHVGDLVALNYGEPFKVGGIRDAGNQWHIFRYELNRWWSPLDLHHVKPRTLEDVLREFGDWYAHTKGGCDEDTVMSEYAAEIRELLGVDA